MNNNFTIDKIKNSIEKGGNVFKKKSQNLLEISKMSVKINSLENNMNEYYKRIGKKVYKNFKDGEKIDKNYIKYCKKIEKLKSEIYSLREEVLKNKDRKLCKVCNEEIEKDSEFCSYCGSKQ
ncbi:hypothetical protein FDF74_10260 [Clostridium niameyense]|uniref:Zinc-ribbon domain-containing protein n=1 Tax=Clostridium niameyense TaxID=1622073 RepID=A0A6M0RBH3_9CLOT|nr:zinc-ribbon domain-containing protein [Clostridium niameyense]NEZ47573.1 hypothetical protein [Clostridium niameyense]